MAQCAGVWNVERLGRRGGNEAEGVGMHVHVLDRLFDQRHMAGDALAACAVWLVMRMGGNAVREWADRRVRSVATQAKRVALLPQHRDVVAAVRIVT